MALTACCPESLALLYVSQPDVTILTAFRKSQQPISVQLDNPEQQNALVGSVVVVLSPGRESKARQVVCVTSTDDLHLCDGSIVGLRHLSPSSFEGFSPQQLHWLCCELNWRMLNGLSPRFKAADEVGEATGSMKSKNNPRASVGFKLRLRSSSII